MIKAGRAQTKCGNGAVGYRRELPSIEITFPRDTILNKDLPQSVNVICLRNNTCETSRQKIVQVAKRLEVRNVQVAKRLVTVYSESKKIESSVSVEISQ